MFQSLIFPSKDPEMKNWSFLGWKTMAVTKSMCWKMQRHSSLLMCHSLTVLSMLLVRMKKFLLQDTSSRSLVWPV